MRTIVGGDYMNRHNIYRDKVLQHRNRTRSCEQERPYPVRGVIDDGTDLRKIGLIIKPFDYRPSILATM